MRRRGALQDMSFGVYDDGDPIRDTIAYIFWTWYEGHLDDEIVKLKAFIFNVTVRVHHLEALFEILFGDKPQ